MCRRPTPQESDLAVLTELPLPGPARDRDELAGDLCLATNCTTDPERAQQLTYDARSNGTAARAALPLR